MAEYHHRVHEGRKGLPIGTLLHAQSQEVEFRGKRESTEDNTPLGRDICSKHFDPILELVISALEVNVLLHYPAQRGDVNAVVVENGRGHGKPRRRLGRARKRDLLPLKGLDLVVQQRARLGEIRIHASQIPCELLDLTR